jgi:hypothetical protein
LYVFSINQIKLIAHTLTTTIKKGQKEYIMYHTINVACTIYTYNTRHRWYVLYVHADSLGNWVGATQVNGVL